MNEVKGFVYNEIGGIDKEIRPDHQLPPFKTIWIQDLIQGSMRITPQIHTINPGEYLFRACLSPGAYPVFPNRVEERFFTGSFHGS